ncbi:hypothetical protein GGI09_002859 [Coemansia sp. S100]|nr:hypothetical protein GGI14_002576 [Coemansia sp. S680]KAJ2099291.1 hypothetical protein GGI09_002859 [Coemansia sp. S100]
MASSAIISVVALVGLVVLGVVVTILFHCVYRRWRRNPANSPNASQYQLRTQTEQLKPIQVFSEHELALLPIKVLTSKELHHSAPVEADNSHPADIGSGCECGKSRKRYFTPDCSICLAEYKVLDVVRVLECGHYFHQSCIDDWLTNHNVNCPICKANMIVAMNLPPRQSAVIKQQQQPPLSYEPLSSIRPPPRAATNIQEARLH